MVTSEVEFESMKWLNYLGNREALRNRESKYCENLLLLVNAEHDYRKFFQAKQMMLTDIFKNTENLLINMDKAVIQLLDKEDAALLMNDEVFA